jgi:hypothetical protein
MDRVLVHRWIPHEPHRDTLLDNFSSIIYLMRNLYSCFPALSLHILVADRPQLTFAD